MQEVVTRSGWDLREMTTGWQNLSRYHRHETAMARGGFGDSDIRKREGRGVGAVSLQVALSGLRMVAIFLVMLAGRGQAHFFARHRS
jgi:hypothetical protein